MAAANRRILGRFHSPPSSFANSTLNDYFVKTLICKFEIAQIKPAEFWPSFFAVFHTLTTREAFQEVMKILSILSTTSGNLSPCAYSLPGNILKFRGNVPEIEFMKTQLTISIQTPNGQTETTRQLIEDEIHKFYE